VVFAEFDNIGIKSGGFELRFHGTQKTANSCKLRRCEFCIEKNSKCNTTHITQSDGYMRCPIPTPEQSTQFFVKIFDDLGLAKEAIVNASRTKMISLF
jgi:hypothetical protein